MPTPPDGPPKKSIKINIITPFEEITRILEDRVCLKIGRQVRGPQEKLASLAINDLPEPSQQSPTSPTPLSDAETPATVFNTPATPRSAAIPSPESSTEKLDNLSIWFKSKVVSRSHAEIWFKDGHIYLRDCGSSSGTFLNKMRLSPANKISRPYPLKQNDIVQLGVDYQGRTEDIYRAVSMKITMENSREISQLQKLIPERFKRALQQLLVATNPYSSQKEHEPTDTSIDCCICIGEIGPFQALFIAPCSHCFHFKCVQHFVRDTVMFPCPICRQVANLEASVSMESVIDWKQKSFHPSYASLDEVDILSSMSPTPRTPFGLQMANLSTSDGGLPSPIAEGELHNDHDMLD